MPWLYLIIAAVFEVGWPVGLKLAQTQSIIKYLWIAFAIIAIALSGYFLYLAQKDIPIGTAYSIWTGIGSIGTFLVGIAFFHDTSSLIRFLGILLILSGIIILKVCH